MTINESEILPSTLNLKIIKDENNKLKEKVNNFEALKVKINNFKFELNKKYQKLDEEKTESNKKIAIIKNYYRSVIDISIKLKFSFLSSIACLKFSVVCKWYKEILCYCGFIRKFD